MEKECDRQGSAGLFFFDKIMSILHLSGYKWHFDEVILNKVKKRSMLEI